jgi:hypothetical protein
MNLENFVEYSESHLKSENKGEPSIFLDLFFTAIDLLQPIAPLTLPQQELLFLQFSAERNWKNVNPAIFGTIFQQGLEKGERHILGAHYTSELDIKKIIDPILVQPCT